MIGMFIVVAIVFLVVNGSVYLSALWFLKRGLKDFPRKSHYLAWPVILLAANLYVGFVLTPQTKSNYAKIEEGMLYETRPTPSHIAIIGYSSSQSNPCHTLCMELLFEGQVSYVTVIWDNLRRGKQNETKYVTFEEWQGDCLNDPDGFSQSGLIHALHGNCLRTVDAPTAPAATIVLNQNLNYFYTSTLKGRKSNYRKGIAIFDDTPPQEKPLAIQAEYTPEIIFIPLTFKVVSSAGHEMNMKLDWSFITRRMKRSQEILQVPPSPYTEEGARLEGASDYRLLNASLGYNVDSIIDFSNYDKPSVEEAATIIRKIFEGDNRSSIEIASRFSVSYEGFPFLELMKTFVNSENGSAAIWAQRYVDRWIRVNDPEQYKQNLTDRKKKREDEKTAREFENAKRHCERKWERDKRDCSQYQSDTANNE